MALLSNPQLGSSANSDNLYGKFNLRFVIDFQLSESVLEIFHEEKDSLLTFFMNILSAVTSIMGFFEVTMILIESCLEQN